MFRTVEVPVWLLALIVLFAAVAALTHVLVPSVRWYFRRRMEHLVGQLNKRLAQPIRPFKLMRRNDMIVRLVHDPGVMAAVVAEAAQTGEPESVVFGRARRYAREIVPAFSASVYFGIAARLARWLSRVLYRVRIGKFDEDRIMAIDREATVVFVMNHRSNMDYVLLTHLASDRTSLSYAVGEWARIWPLSRLIRATGAYFIRRGSSNPLYRRVLARYVQMATEEGVPQAIFPEGGLSLDGHPRRARLGILSYMVQGFDPARSRDVVFVPVAINYDRVLEDRVLIAAHQRGDRKFGARIPTMLAFAIRNLWRGLRGRFRRFGHAAVSFGEPLSLKEFLTHDHADAAALGAELMGRIDAVMSVLPVPLVAAALVGQDRAETAPLVARIAAQVVALRARGVPVVPGRRPEDVARIGIGELALRGILSERAGILSVRAGEAPLLAFYAASIAPHLRALGSN